MLSMKHWLIYGFLFVCRFGSSGYSQSASLRSSTPNNCSAVYQEELALLLIQASPHPLLIAFRNPAGDLLDLVKFSVVQHFVPGQRIVDVLILGTAVNNSKML